MPVEIRVPQMGESVTEGVIAQWLKKVGDSVAADEPVVEVETDKITVEIPAPSAGVLKRQSVGEGDTVAVGDIVGEIEAGAGAGAPAPAPKASSGDGAAKAEPRATEAAQKSQPAPDVRPHEGPAAMPAARAEADRRGVDVSTIEGTGRGGRVLKEDVQRAPAPAPRPAPAARPAPSTPGEHPEERKTLSPLRKRVAARLVESQKSTATLTTFNEVDMSEVIALRKHWQERFVARHGVKLGFMSFFVKAAVEALQAFPIVNSELDGDDLVYKKYYDIGVAVGSGKGLVVPVIRGADRLSFADIELAIADFGERAKANKLTLEDLTGGTFTVSNGGVYGSMLSTPILNPPQTGILGLHNIVERPTAVAGKVEIRPIMYLALSYDHRVLDGREAVQFLVRIKECIESPERLLLEV
jgi:2-oxoglutarate dehydrogenase E2 component (dihydrolipoamide succinyltransferase)